MNHNRLQTSIDTEKKYVKMKQDVYEHLAKTFLDKKKKKKSLKNKNLWFIAIPLILFFIVFSYVLGIILVKNKVFLKSIYIAQDKTPVILEYDFTPLGISKIKAISFNLANTDLSGYKFFDISIRTEQKTQPDSTIKIEIENSLLEKDTKYISGINSGWQKFSLPLSDFKLISDWASVKAVSFTVEDWNVSSKKNKVFIDDIRFVE